MAFLANTLNKAEAMARLKEETFARQTVSFYRYVPISNPQALRDALFLAWSELGVLGRVYLAPEGINAQISIPKHNLTAFTEQLASVPEFANIPFKYAIEEPRDAFWKLIIKVRKQIVADNLPEGSYDMRNVGTHLNAQAFNEAIAQGALVVDMRNQYESAIGRFKTAFTPASQTFSDELREVAEVLADKKDEKILLYCTGGIRCEKASAFLKQQGFSDVNQLSGGIIRYTHETREQGLENQFIGKNFVFDNRMAETVSPDILGTCFTCKVPADTYDNCTNDLCHALFIQCASCHENMLGACSDACRAYAARPQEERAMLRKGNKAVFAVHTSQ